MVVVFLVLFLLLLLPFASLLPLPPLLFLSAMAGNRLDRLWTLALGQTNRQTSLLVNGKTEAIQLCTV